MPDDNESPANLRYDIDRHEDDLTRETKRINELEKEVESLKITKDTLSEAVDVISLLYELLGKCARTPPREDALQVERDLRAALTKLRADIQRTRSQPGE